MLPGLSTGQRQLQSVRGLRVPRCGPVEVAPHRAAPSRGLVRPLDLEQDDGGGLGDLAHDGAHTHPYILAAGHGEPWQQRERIKL